MEQASDPQKRGLCCGLACRMIRLYNSITNDPTENMKNYEYQFGLCPSDQKKMAQKKRQDLEAEWNPENKASN